MILIRVLTTWINIDLQSQDRTILTLKTDKPLKTLGNYGWNLS